MTTLDVNQQTMPPQDGGNALSNILGWSQQPQNANLLALVGAQLLGSGAAGQKTGTGVAQAIQLGILGHARNQALARKQAQEDAAAAAAKEEHDSRMAIAGLNRRKGEAELSDYEATRGDRLRRSKTDADRSETQARTALSDEKLSAAKATVAEFESRPDRLDATWKEKRAYEKAKLALEQAKTKAEGERAGYYSSQAKYQDERSRASGAGGNSVAAAVQLRQDKLNSWRIAHPRKEGEFTEDYEARTEKDFLDWEAMANRKNDIEQARQAVLTSMSNGGNLEKDQAAMEKALRLPAGTLFLDEEARAGGNDPAPATTTGDTGGKGGQMQRTAGGKIGGGPQGNDAAEAKLLKVPDRVNSAFIQARIDAAAARGATLTKAQMKALLRKKNPNVKFED